MHPDSGPFRQGSRLAEGPPSVDVSGLCVTLGGRSILRDIDLELPAGELIGILGPNGAGKSTLLGAITGLIPSAAGTIRLFGTDVGSMPPRQRARTVAILPQNIETPFHFHVEEVVMMGRYASPSSSSDDRMRAKEALELCGIAHLAGRSFLNLSGGERRLVLLARCICQDSPLFLLDEATASLDIKRKIEVFELLRQQVETRGRTVVIVIHDINLASLYLDRLLFLKGGSIAGQGTVEELLNSSHLTRVFETRTIVVEHPECNRPAVLFSPRQGEPGVETNEGGNSHV